MTIPSNKILIPVIAVVVIVVIAVAAFLGVRSSTYALSNEAIDRKLMRSHGIKRPSERKIVGNRSESSEINWGGASTSESRDRLSKLKELLASGDEIKIVDALQEAEQLAAPELIEFATYVLKTQPDANTRWDALGMVGKLSTKAIIPALELGMDDENGLVRTTAIEALTQFNDGREQYLKGLSEKKTLTEEEHSLLEKQTLTNDDMHRISEMFLKAMNDKESDVVNAVLSNLELMHGDLQLVALNAGLHSKNANVRKEILDTISVNSNKDTIWLVIDALKGAEQDTFAQAQELLEHTFGQKFDNSSEAEKWWKSNEANYNYDLIEIDTDTDSDSDN